jgi:hypothetical protein
MSSIVVAGDTSGSVTLAAPAVSGTTTLTLPTTSGTVLTTATSQTLTSPVFAGTPTGVGVLTADTAQATTSGTFKDFTGIPSWVKRITVMFNGFSTNGSSFPQIQLGDSGGIETTSYLCGSSIILNSVGSANYTAGFTIGGSAGNWTSSRVAQGAITITNISANNWVAFGVLSGSDAAYTLLLGGSKTLSDVLTQIRITTVNGTDTFDAGSVNILYE